MFYASPVQYLSPSHQSHRPPISSRCWSFHSRTLALFPPWQSTPHVLAPKEHRHRESCGIENPASYDEQVYSSGQHWPRNRGLSWEVGTARRTAEEEVCREFVRGFCAETLGVVFPLVRARRLLLDVQPTRTPVISISASITSGYTSSEASIVAASSSD